MEGCNEGGHGAREGRVVIEAAIPSKDFRDKCSKMWYVYTSRENRLERLKANRGYTREKTLSIMDNQVSDEVFRSFCDSVIDNNKSLGRDKEADCCAYAAHLTESDFQTYPK